MTPPPLHQCQVFASPWEGVYCTQAESSRHYGKHWHAVYGLGLLDDGAQSSASGRGQVDAYAGDLITTNPGEVHDGQPLGSAPRRWRMVYVEPGALHALAAEDHGGAAGRGDIAFTRPVIQDAALALALRTLFTRVAHWNALDPLDPHGPPQAAAPSAVHRLACEESLARTCALLLRHHANLVPAPAGHMAHAAPALQQVRDWLADAPLQPPTLAQMAAFAGLSRYQLLRRFAGTYGLPPHAWLLQQRAERSRHLIRRGASLADAAAASGFADQSHMTRIFARQFGFTPGAWQKAHRAHPAQ